MPVNHNNNQHDSLTLKVHTNLGGYHQLSNWMLGQFSKRKMTPGSRNPVSYLRLEKSWTLEENL